MAYSFANTTRATGENGYEIVTAYAKHLDTLWAEIAVYLSFMDEAREDDHLWKEYCAWKRLTDAGATLRYRAAR